MLNIFLQFLAYTWHLYVPHSIQISLEYFMQDLLLPVQLCPTFCFNIHLILLTIFRNCFSSCVKYFLGERKWSVWYSLQEVWMCE